MDFANDLFYAWFQHTTLIEIVIATLLFIFLWPASFIAAMTQTFDFWISAITATLVAGISALIAPKLLKYIVETISPGVAEGLQHVGLITNIGIN